MRTDLLRQIVVALALPLGVAVNLLQISSAQSTRLRASMTPEFRAAPFAFSIWSVIFAGHIGYAVYQALPSQRTSPVHRRAGWHAALVGVLGAVWSFSATYDVPLLGLGAIVAMVASLCAMETRLGVANRRVEGRDYWLVRLPFALNLGWVSVATLLSAALNLRDAGWSGWPLRPVQWSLVLLAVAGALALVMVWRRASVGFALAVGWGCVGLAYGSEPLVVSNAASLTAVVVLLATLAYALLNLRPLRRSRAR